MISKNNSDNALKLNITLATVLALMLALLAGCGSPDRSRRPLAPLTQIVPTPQLAASLLAEGDTAQAAHVYAQLASDETNPSVALQYQLLATELYFDSDLYRDALRAYELLPEPWPDPTLQTRRSLLDGYFQLAQQEPATALEIVPQPRSLNDRVLTIRALEIQARAHEALADPVQALKARILIEANLTVASSITRNREATRDMLARVDTRSLQQMASIPGGTVYRGWVDYTLLQRTGQGSDTAALEQRTQIWNTRYPGHPASLTESSPLADAPLAGGSAISTDRVALLLPLSGKFSEVGNAIKTGFLAARFNNNPNPNADIRILDTGSDLQQTLAQYEAAVAGGASLIVGPLSKSAVIKLAATNRISVPTLSLNYTNEDITPNANLYQFGLLPEDEARDAANYLLAQNLKNVLIVAADSVIGSRLSTAFTETLQQNGGRVLGVESVSQDSYDYSPQLKKLLAINESNARRRQLQKLLDTKLEFDPSIRGDVEAIFIAVDAAQARLLRPQLQFHRANALPLISTSQIFSGTVDTRADGDLTGVIYNELPWITDDANQASTLHQQIAATMVEPNPRMSRLHALGVDAWKLHSQLENMRFDQIFSIPGKTGALTLTEGNRIRRRLNWSEFRAGEPAKLSGPLPVETVLPVIATEL